MNKTLLPDQAKQFSLFVKNVKDLAKTQLKLPVAVHVKFFWVKLPYFINRSSDLQTQIKI